MDTLVDDLSARLAHRLRLERDSRGWSLADLAERSGVSKATISKIERAEVSPTAVVLVRLASAFDLTLAGLMLRAEGQGERLSRAAEQPVWRDPETGYLRTQVFSRPDHPVEIIRVEMPAKQRVTLPASSYAHIRQVLWVLSGALVLIDGGERHELRRRRLPRIRSAGGSDVCQRERRALHLCRCPCPELARDVGDRHRRSPADPASLHAPAGHNGGPPLDEEHTPEWGNGGIGNYFYWKAAHRRAWSNPSPGIVAFRIRKAERLGLTYEEYTLEILERGRHLQIEDVERIAEIKQARAARTADNRSENA